MKVQLKHLLGTPLRARPGRGWSLLIVPVVLAVLALTAPAAIADPVGQINEFPTGTPAGSAPEPIAAGPDGNLWFTDEGPKPAIGRITPSGQINEFTCGRPCIRRVALTARFTLNVAATVTFAIARALPGRLTQGRCTAPTRTDRHHRACTRPVTLHGITVINAGAGADAFTFTGKLDGRGLVPGSYRLLATPTADGIAGLQQLTTFEIRR